MEKLKLIITREYLSMVGRKSFIIMTILIPFMLVLLALLPIAIGYFNNEGADIEKVAVIDQSGKYGKAITDTDNYRFVLMSDNDAGADPRQFYDKTREDLEAIVVIPRDIDSTLAASIYSENTVNLALKQHINNALNDTITHARLAEHHVADIQKIIDESTVDVNVTSIKWSKDGSEEESSAEMAMILGMVLSLLTYMFVLMYGAMIMNGVIEEKTNRIVEVIVSSCRPFQLMMGKIIGVALVGLTQLAIWTVLMTVVAMAAGPLMGLGAMDMFHASDPQMTAAIEQSVQGGGSDIIKALLSINYAEIFTCFVIYFIGGYLLYAALFAAFGSAVDQASDASQFTMPIMMIMIVALYAGIACAENPNGPMAVWCSMIPFTSPIVMMVRLPYNVPLWQLLLSIVLLFATAVLTVWVAARIYRTGILLYGKKTSFKDILRWVK